MWQNLGIYVHSAQGRWKTACNIAISIEKIFNGNILATSCANMMKCGSLTPEIMRITNAPFWWRRQKSAYLTEYLSNYATDLQRTFSFGRRMYVNYKTDKSFAVAKRTLLW